MIDSPPIAAPLKLGSRLANIRDGRRGLVIQKRSDHHGTVFGVRTSHLMFKHKSIVIGIAPEDLREPGCPWVALAG